MKVITEYPIMVNNKVVSKGAWATHFDGEKFSYLPAKPAKSVQDYVAKQPTPAQKEAAKKQGLTWDAVKGGWVKANESVGLLTQTIGGIKGLFGKGDSAGVGSAPAPSPEPEAEKKSNLPLIIGIGVAAAIVITVIVVKNKKG